MPRIDASSIEEHIRVQTARILEAASRLFQERGYRKTDMDDIASEVGLARNSLYRYYRNKDAILVACVERDMEAFTAEMRRLAEVHPDPAERIGAWLDLQIDMATSPAHAGLEMMTEIRTDAPALRKRLAELHDAPSVVLEETVAELVRGRRRDTGLLVALVKAMVDAAALQAMARDNRAAVKRELRRAVERMLSN
ncbi:MAG: TetR/AcrR family transcriptional regulator [Gammaproteobacteria bacterium]|nr:TetR/AcrR family transcriptional regulator [Gammaproteobacteria bacterium]